MHNAFGFDNFSRLESCFLDFVLLDNNSSSNTLHCVYRLWICILPLRYKLRPLHFFSRLPWGCLTSIPVCLSYWFNIRCKHCCTPSTSPTRLFLSDETVTVLFTKCLHYSSPFIIPPAGHLGLIFYKLDNVKW